MWKSRNFQTRKRCPPAEIDATSTLFEHAMDFPREIKFPLLDWGYFIYSYHKF